MAHLDFTLKLLSPAFVAGADLLEENIEGIKMKRLLVKDDLFRIPSIRGIFRFWFRALYGTLCTSIKELREREGEIWGDINYGQGIRIISRGNENVTWGEISVTQDSNIGYLGYGPLLFKKDKDEKKRFTSYHTNPKSNRRDAIYPGSLFHFKAFYENTDQIEALKKVLILVHLFGGIGSRSRRGWGSLSVEGDFIPIMNSGESIKDWFEKCMRAVWDKSEEKPSNKKDLPKFSAFSIHTKIKLSQNPHSSFEDVMKEFGEQFKATRQWNIHDSALSPQIAREDHDLEKNDSENNTLTALPKRLSFGLPYYPKSRNGWEIEYKGYYANPKNLQEKIKIERRASPLFLKVFQAPDKNLYAVSLFLKSQFFGRDNAEAGSNNPNKTLPVTDWSAIDAFLNRKDWQKINLP